MWCASSPTTKPASGWCARSRSRPRELAGGDPLPQHGPSGRAQEGEPLQDRTGRLTRRRGRAPASRMRRARPRQSPAAMSQFAEKAGHYWPPPEGAARPDLSTDKAGRPHRSARDRAGHRRIRRKESGQKATGVGGARVKRTQARTSKMLLFRTSMKGTDGRRRSARLRGSLQDECPSVGLRNLLAFVVLRFLTQRVSEPSLTASSTPPPRGRRQRPRRLLQV